MMSTQTWRKSSKSGSNAQCVELSVGSTQTSIRDSKNPDAGVLTFSACGWDGFLRAAKAGEFGSS
jgi:Domain of unknown function (DUF397)